MHTMLNEELFTLLQFDIEAKSIIELIDSVEKEEQDYWVKLGYKYFGLPVYIFDNGLQQEVSSRGVLNHVDHLTKFLKILFCEENVPQTKVIKEKLWKGINRFVVDIQNKGINKANKEMAYKIMQAFAFNLSQYDSRHIGALTYPKEIDGEIVELPISIRKKPALGMVYPWPGTNSAESELLVRYGKATQNIDVDYFMLSDFGEILDVDQKVTKNYVNPNDVDFIITSHYESHKSIDALYYHLVWNPPEIPLNTSYYEGKVVDNYLMNDDYLIYDAGGMSNHLKSILINKPRSLEDASTLVGSFPKSEILEPKLENPKLFYCGMNWEKVVNNSNRHEGLFKLLDNEGCVKFFGPEVVEAWGGIRPWGGYKCYQYSIPFDGFSVLKEINDCGICLAISSDIHRRAGAVTNRTYEACAAGAVIISDNNEFMEKHFKDAVLFIEYNKNDPEDTFKQIMEKYHWIVNNKEAALDLARKSQQIFVEKFCMEKQLLNVIQKHHSRFLAVEESLFAKDTMKKVMVVSVINTIDVERAEKWLNKIYLNVKNQYYQNIEFVVVCDKKIMDDLATIAAKLSYGINLVPKSIFDQKKSKVITDAQVIFEILQEQDYEYFVCLSEDEYWNYDHITTLVRTLEDEEDSMAAYSGLLSMDREGYKRTMIFGNLQPDTLYLQIHPNCLPVSGQILFRKGAEQYMDNFMLNNIDGLEHTALLNLLKFKYKKPITFSKRMTCVYQYDYKTVKYSTIDKDRQIRFIRGMVKYDLPDNSNFLQQNVVMDDKLVMEKVMNLPIRSWLKMRWYRFWIRLFSPKSKVKKALSIKYEKELNNFKEKF